MERVRIMNAVKLRAGFEGAGLRASFLEGGAAQPLTGDKKSKKRAPNADRANKGPNDERMRRKLRDC